jgi:hypothetical protein
MYLRNVGWPAKCRLTFAGLNGVISQKTELFAVTIFKYMDIICFKFVNIYTKKYLYGIQIS